MCSFRLGDCLHVLPLRGRGGGERYTGVAYINNSLSEWIIERLVTDVRHSNKLKLSSCIISLLLLVEVWTEGGE